MSAYLSTISRSGAFACVAALHAVLIYAIAVSIGVLDVPLPHVFEATILPAEKPVVPMTPIMPITIPSLANRNVIDLSPPIIELEQTNPSDGSEVGAVEETEDKGSGPALHEPERVIAATPLLTREPLYPAGSIRENEQGLVVVNVLVGPDGRVEDVVVLKSSGYSRLDDAAVKSARGWKFKPGTRGGIAAATWVSLPVRFQLRN
jgi:protein TonB